MAKPINRKKQKRFYKLLAVGLYLLVLYFGCHVGYVVQGEELSAQLIIEALDHCVEKPLKLFPTHKETLGKFAILGLIVPLVVHTEYLRRRDLRPEVESGSARWNEELKDFYQTYAEMTAWPVIFERNRFLKKVKALIIRANEVLSKIPVISFFHQKIALALIKQFQHPEEGSGSQNMILSKEVFLSMNQRKTRRNCNTLIIGGSGTGKSRFEVKPNILQTNASFVVTDPSGELLESMGQFLEREGYEIRVFNLVQMEHSNCYNPFHYIRNQEGVLIMINALIKNTTPKGSSTSDPFWEKAETALLQAICFFLVSECNIEDQNFSSVMKLLRCAKAIEGQEDVDSTLDVMFKDLEAREPEHIAVQSYKVFKSAGGGKTAQSILISCQTRLQTFNLDAIRNLTSIDNIDLGSLGEKKVALFCITPSADTTFNYMVALLYTQLFETLYYRAENCYDEKRLPYHVRFLLDEFANIGSIPDFNQKLSTMRKYEISCTVIVQALSQLKAMYKDDWDVLVANCDSQIFLGGSDATTLEYFSKSLGKETIRSINNTRSYGKQGSHSLSYNKTGRELMTPDELRVMSNDDCVIFIRGLYPFYARKYPYDKHPNYRYTGDCNKKFKYDVRKSLHTGQNMDRIRGRVSLSQKVFSEAQRSDTREGDRQYRQNSRPVQMTSARGRQMHAPRPLTDEIPNLHIPRGRRTAEQQAQTEAAIKTIAIEEIVEPDAEDMISYQVDIHNAWYGVDPAEYSFPDAEDITEDRGEY